MLFARLFITIDVSSLFIMMKILIEINIIVYRGREKPNLMDSSLHQDYFTIINCILVAAKHLWA